MPPQLVTAPKERRANSRVPSRLKIPCRIQNATEEGRWLATVLDVSTSGIGLIVNRPFTNGMMLTLELPTDGRNPGRPQPRLVRVMHTKPHLNNRLGNQTWVLGGVFVRKLTRVELDELRSRSPAIVPHHERRTAVRHTTKMKTPCPVVRAIEEGPWWAKVRNVTRNGISLIASRPFRAGSFLAIELPMAGGLFMGKPRLLRITNARPQGDHKWWILGGKFIAPLTAGEVAALS